MKKTLFGLFLAVILLVVPSSTQELEPKIRRQPDPKESVEFGKEVRASQFLLNYTNFNHGSFGACPRQVLEYQESLRLQQEQQPDIWFRKTYYELQNQTRAKLADYVGLKTPAEKEGLVLVESASTAVNSILRSFPWSAGDVLVQFSVAYPMVSHTASWLSSERKIQIATVNISFPVLDEQAFLKPMEDFLKSWVGKQDGGLPRVFVLDHIISTPAVIEPIHELAALIKSYQPNAFVLVDGAHAIGEVYPPLSLPVIGNLDAYVSNGHKWLYSPKGSAFLWVNLTHSRPGPNNHSSGSSWISPTFPEPTVISSANNPLAPTSFSERYAYVSTREYTAILSIGAALDFRNDILGGDLAINGYCKGLATRAKSMLTELWGVSDKPPLAPDSMEAFMINVPLPDAINSVDVGLRLMNYLLDEHDIYMLVLWEESSKMFYTRLSAQVYLDLEDFQQLGYLVQKFAEVHGAGKREG